MHTCIVYSQMYLHPGMATLKTLLCGPCPLLLVALILKMYRSPGVRPSMVAVVVLPRCVTLFIPNGFIAGA